MDDREEISDEVKFEKVNRALMKILEKKYEIKIDAQILRKEEKVS